MTPFDEISEIYFWYFVLIIAIATMVVYIAPSIIALKRKIKEHLKYKVMELDDKKISKTSSDLFNRFTQIYRETKIKNTL